MSKGIAIHFVDKFKMVRQLKRSNAKVGDTVVLKNGHQFVYYLVTKAKKTGKPLYQSVRKALRVMKRHAERNNVPEISLPKIGCGLGMGTRSWIQSRLSRMTFIVEELQFFILKFLYDKCHS